MTTLLYPNAGDPNPPLALAKDKPRLMMIDVAKGIGILLIVLGHNPIFSRNFEGFSDLLSAFRLPFFFFISGTMFSVGRRTVREVAWQRADAWLKPVIVVILLNGIVRNILGRTTLETTLLELVYQTGFTLMWTPMWFLPHLWLLYVVVTWLITTIPSLTRGGWRQTALVAGLLIAGHFILKQFDEAMINPACNRTTAFKMDLLDCGLPFSADLLLITSAFFLLGYFLSARTKQFQINQAILLLALVVMSVCQWFFDADVDFNHRVYDDLIICTLQAFSGIYIMLCLCSVLARFDNLAKLFAYCGRASLFILIFHAPVLYKLVDLLQPRIASKSVVGILAFVVPLAVSIVIWNICKRSRWLSLLMLPVSRKGAKPALAPATSAPPTAP